MPTALELKGIGFAIIVGSAVAYHYADVAIKVHDAHAEDKAQIDAANAAYQAEHALVQAKLDPQSAQQNADAQDKFDATQQDIAAIKGMLAKQTKYSKPLPKDCLFDDERIKSANEALK